MEQLDFDNRNFSFTELGAITLLDNSNLNDETIVDITILTKDIHKIYKTTKTVASTFDIADFKDVKELAIQDFLNNLSNPQNTKNTSQLIPNTSGNSEIQYENVPRRRNCFWRYK